MWGLLGDGSRGPAGTFFHRHAEQEAYFWNMFDQVLVRPALLDRFDFKDLAILDDITPARKFRILAHTNPTRQRGL